MAREAERSSCFTIAPRLLRRRAKIVFLRDLSFPGGYLPGVIEEADGVGTWRLWKAFWNVGMALTKVWRWKAMSLVCSTRCV